MMNESEMRMKCDSGNSRCRIPYSNLYPYELLHESLSQCEPQRYNE